MSAFLTDVSAKLPPDWQAVDIAATALKIALRGRSMQKAPATVALLQSCLNTLTTLLTSRTSGQGPSGATSPQTEARPAASEANVGAADADAQPSAGEAE